MALLLHSRVPAVSDFKFSSRQMCISAFHFIQKNLIYSSYLIRHLKANGKINSMFVLYLCSRFSLVSPRPNISSTVAQTSIQTWRLAMIRKLFQDADGIQSLFCSADVFKANTIFHHIRLWLYLIPSIHSRDFLVIGLEALEAHLLLIEVVDFPTAL